MLLWLLVLGKLFGASAAQQYTVTATRLTVNPLLSRYNSAFNWTYASALYTGVDGRIYILVRCENTTAAAPYEINYGQLATSVFTNSQFTSATALTPANVSLSPTNAAERCGVQDPRVAYFNGTYFAFFTAWGCPGTYYTLALATSLDPRNASGWTRITDNIFSGANRIHYSKSGAPLFRSVPPHYLFWGDGAGGFGISVATSLDGLEWKNVQTNFIDTRAEGFDSAVIEAGPPPLPLSDGNYLMIYNSARRGFPSVKPGFDLQYNMGYAILEGENPASILARSGVTQPLFSPVLPWEVGNATDPLSLTPNVVFCDGMVPFPGETDSFLFVYGAADSAVGVGKITVTKA